jgi:hypothetical protein
MTAATSRSKVARSIVAAAVALPATLSAGAGTAHASSVGFELQPWPGGLTVLVYNDFSEPAWCTYTADWYQSMRFLAEPKGTNQVVIVPSVPEFRNWNAVVSCDNGQSVRRTVFY